MSANVFSNLEFALKIARLISETQPEDLEQMISDAAAIVKVLYVAPYGASLAQIASLVYLDEGYTRGILNILSRGGIVEESGGIFKLKGGQ